MQFIAEWSAIRPEPEVFFFGLPTKQERSSIFKVHLTKYRPNFVLSEDNLSLLSDLSNNFSGAEIEQSIIDSMRIGFNEDREFNIPDILSSISNVVPLARTRYKELQKLQELCDSGNIRNASCDEKAL